MLCELLIDHCAPTLAGIKTGSLFRCGASAKEMIPCIRAMNRVLVCRGIRLIPLHTDAQGTLLYLYRPDRLQSDFSCKAAAGLLRQLGYEPDTPARCIKKLRSKLSAQRDFPHEIGLFLGYPPEDVSGFIANHAQNAKYCGAWKVYGDVEQAKRRFAEYRACTRYYRNSYRRHTPLEQLAVSAS